MKVGVLGCGLGYSLACILGSHKHDVVALDTNPKAFLKPRLSPDMKAYCVAHADAIKQHVRFETDYKYMVDRELVFIFVSTPLVDGRLSMKHVKNAVASTLKYNGVTTFALLSTMPVGGLAELFSESPELIDTLNYAPPQIVANRFYETFIHSPTDYQMISDNADSSKLTGIYRSLFHPKVKLIFAAYQIIEVAKLLVNVYLTSKIVFANAVDDWTRQNGLNANKIMQLVGADPRIGNQYLTPDGAAGGPCFPRDLAELISVSDKTGLGSLLSTLKALNDERAKTHPSRI